jgi:hypothetical protein
MDMVNGCILSTNEKLLNLIKLKRSELLSLAADNELTNYNVVKCSQELDILIYELQSLYRNRTISNRIDLREMDGIH